MKLHFVRMTIPAALIAAFRAGCSGSKSSTPRSLAFTNFLNLDGRTVSPVMGTGRSVISGHLAIHANFSDQIFDQGNAVTFTGDSLLPLTSAITRGGSPDTVTATLSVDANDA